MLTAVQQGRASSLVDALLAQHNWARTLNDDDVRALRQHEVDVQALDVELRAHRVYRAAYQRSIAAKRSPSKGTHHRALLQDLASVAVAELLLPLSTHMRVASAQTRVMRSCQWADHLEVWRADAGCTRYGARAVALLRKRPELSKVDAILTTRPAMRKRLRDADVLTLRQAEAVYTEAPAAVVHRLVKLGDRLAYREEDVNITRSGVLVGFVIIRCKLHWPALKQL